MSRGFGGPMTALSSARKPMTSSYGSGASVSTTPTSNKGIAGTVTPGAGYLDAGGREQVSNAVGSETVHNAPYASNQQEFQVHARPDGTWQQVTRQWDPRTGTYVTGEVQKGGAHKKQTTTRSGGPGGYDDLDIDDFYRAKGVLPNLPPRELPPSQADRTAAEAAAYGRAKDRIGLNAQAGLRAMQGLMAARGISGSGIEAALSEGTVGAALGQLGEVARDQAITGLQRDWAVEDRDWAGNIQQRGQDISGLNSRNADIFRLMDMTRKRRADQPESSTTESWVY